MPKKQLVAEALIDLHRRLSALPSRSHDRRMIMRETATLYGLSEQTLYRALAERARPRALRRSDRGTPWVLPQDKMQSYCEVIAALKVRTSNKKGWHLSTGEAIRLIEEFGVETPDGLAQAPKSILKKTTSTVTCDSGAMTVRPCVGNPPQSAFRLNTATIAGNST
jgi:predicted DNA-binding transcriptional regulator AlpA